MAAKIRELYETVRLHMFRGKIVDGRVAKIFKERALLEQAFIKDTSKTVAEHIKQQVATIGENIQVCVLGVPLDHHQPDKLLCQAGMGHIECDSIHHPPWMLPMS